MAKWSKCPTASSSKWSRAASSVSLPRPLPFPAPIQLLGRCTRSCVRSVSDLWARAALTRSEPSLPSCHLHVHVAVASASLLGSALRARGRARVVDGQGRRREMAKACDARGGLTVMGRLGSRNTTGDDSARRRRDRRAQDPRLGIVAPSRQRRQSNARGRCLVGSAF